MQRILEAPELRAQRRQVESIIAKAQRDGELSVFDEIHGLASRGQSQTAAGQRVSALSGEYRRSGAHSGNGMLPLPVEFYARDLTVGTTTAGGHTVATGPKNGSDVVELLRPVSLLARLGATILTGISGHGNLSLPRTTSNGAATWVGESTAANVSEPAFDAGVALSPKTVSVQVTFSRKLTKSSGVDVESFVRAHLLRAVMAEIDRAALAGDGSGSAPTGVLNASGTTLQALGTNGLAFAYSHAVAMEKAVGIANAEGLAFVSNSKVRASLRATSDGIGGGAKVWTDADTVCAMPAHASESIPSNLTKGSGTNLSAAIVGDFAQLVVGIWGGIDLIVDPFTNTKGDTKVTALADVAIALRQPAAFAVCRDIIAA